MRPSFPLYTHDSWQDYAWESVNPSRHMAWDVRRCHHGDPHPHPDAGQTVFYTDSELVHAEKHEGVRKVAWMLEARYVTPWFHDHLEANIDVFDEVLTHDDRLLALFPDRCTFYPHGSCTVRRIDFALHDKSRLVSTISSTKQMGLSGHRLRHALYELYRERHQNWTRVLLGDTEVDLYGDLADRHIPDKLECLRDHMFHVAIENCVLDTYFTEKIIDCFVTGTVPIYYGTTKIGDFFDSDGIITFTTLEELFEILGRLTPDDYYNRSRAVARNFLLAQRYVVPEDWIFENTDAMAQAHP